MLLCYLGNHIHIPLGISELNKKEPFFLALFLFFYKGILGCVGIKHKILFHMMPMLMLMLNLLLMMMMGKCKQKKNQQLAQTQAGEEMTWKAVLAGTFRFGFVVKFYVT